MKTSNNTTNCCKLFFFPATAPNGTKHQRKQHKTLPFWSITNDACPSFTSAF